MINVEELKNSFATQIEVCQEIKSLDILKAMVIEQIEKTTDIKRLDLVYRLLRPKR